MLCLKSSGPSNKVWDIICLINLHSLKEKGKPVPNSPPDTIHPTDTECFSIVAQLITNGVSKITFCRRGSVCQTTKLNLINCIHLSAVIVI